MLPPNVPFRVVTRGALTVLALFTAAACADTPATPLASPGATPVAAADVADRMRVTSRLAPARVAAVGGTGRDVQLVFQHPTTSEYVHWKVRNGGVVAFGNYGQVPAAWSLVGGGDMTGDAVDDLFWQHTRGNLVRWQLTAADAIGSVAPLPYYAPAPPWRVAATADLNADGTADLVWQSTGGDVIVWLMGSGGTIQSSVGLGSAPPPWRVATAGRMRFGGVLLPTLLWENPTTGARLVWLMGGDLLGHGVIDLGLVPPAWSLVALADFDDDGENDLFWQNPATGEILVWLMNGTAYRATVSPGGPPPPWRLRAVRPSGAAPTTPMTSVGSPFACALGASGTASCWGTGTLGNGSFAMSSATPVPVQGSGERFGAITAGADHACALNVTGAAFCWGANGLGRGAYSTDPTPRPVVGGLSFIKLGAGNALTCGLTRTGQAYCWGYGFGGQLGTGTTQGDEVYAPAAVQQGGLVFNDLAVAHNHVCALATDGHTYCWGHNDNGQLGDGSSVSRSVPVAVSGGLSFSRVAAGNSYLMAGLTCGLTSVGQAYCWGSNGSGALGNGTTSLTSTPTPQLVQGGQTFTSLAIGGGLAGAHVCGLTRLGQAYCWGANGVGQLGTGAASQAPVTTPTPVAQGGLAFTQLSAGGNTDGVTCAMTASGQAYCWGDNSLQQLGTGTRPYRTTPVPSSTVPTLASVVAGDNFSCGLTPAGQAYCWGSDRRGALGRGASSAGYSATAVPVSGGLTFASLSSFSSHTCGLTPAGQIYCWGAGTLGQLGNGGGSDSPVPVQVQSPQTFSQLSVGDEWSCALTAVGQAYCWGQNRNGQLGDGTTASSRLTPVAVQGGLAFRSIYSGRINSCGVSTPEGKVYCWGWNANGELTPGNPSPPVGGLTTPTLLSGQAGLTFTSVVAAIGSPGICALTTADQAYCWLSTTAPAPVQGVPALKALTMGSRFMCGLSATGQAYCWGVNLNGELGTGGVTDNTVRGASPVAGGLSFKSIAASGAPTEPFGGHVCAVTTGGQTYCWGSYARGQLGDGAVGFSAVPVPVANGGAFDVAAARSAMRAPARPNGARLPMPASPGTVVRMPDPAGTPR